MRRGLRLYRISFQTNCYAWIPQGYIGLYPGISYNLDYALRDLARIGYDGVEVDCVHIWDSRLWTISKSQRAVLKEAINNLGINVEAFSAHDWPLPGASITSTEEASRKLGMEWTKGVIDLAADFGTHIVTTHVPSPRVKSVKLLDGMPFSFLRGGIPLFSLPSECTEEERKLMVQAVGECADYCKDRDVFFAIEEYAPVDFWKGFIKEVNSSALKLNLHIGQVWRHMIRTNGTIQEPSLPQAVHEFGDLIVHTHCMDYRNACSLPPQGTRTTSPTVEVIPGSGECDFHAFIKALRDIDYSGYLTVECHRSDIPPGIQAAQALHNMRKIVAQSSS